jgi:transcriptional regulator with XRE-family HTH domain
MPSQTTSQTNSLVFTAIGNRIKGIRKSKEMSQETLAELCNFKKSNLSRLEKGNINPTIGTLAKIAMALEVSLPYLTDHDGLTDFSSIKNNHSAITFGAQIREQRLKKHLSLTQLATLCQCNQIEIQDLENGNLDSTLSAIKKISAALDLPLTLLLG